MNMISSVQERRPDSFTGRIESLDNNDIVKDIGSKKILCPSCSKRNSSVSGGVHRHYIFTKTLKYETGYCDFVGIPYVISMLKGCSKGYCNTSIGAL